MAGSTQQRPSIGDLTRLGAGQLTDEARNPRTLHPVLFAATDTARTLLGVLGIASLVFGFAAVAALAVWVIRRAPPDGSDVGRDPRLDSDEESRRNGSGTHVEPP